MAASTITNAQLIWGSNDLSTFTGEFDESCQVSMNDADNVAAGGYKIKIPAIFSSLASVKGNADFAAAAVNTAFAGAQLGRQDAFTIVPKGTAAAAADVAIFTRGQLADYQAMIGNTGDTAKFGASLTGDNAMIHGQVLATLASRSGGLTGTAVQLGAVATGPAGVPQRLWAALHVTAAAGTNLALIVQSDTVGFPSPTTAITFSTVSAAGWQFLSLAGPLTDDYFRVSVTIGSGSFTYGVFAGVW